MYQSKLQSEAADHLFEAILSLKSMEECYRFLKTCAQSRNCRRSPSAWRLRRFYAGVKPILPSRKNRRFHRHHLPREPLPFLWRGRLPNRAPAACGRQTRVKRHCENGPANCELPARF